MITFGSAFATVRILTYFHAETIDLMVTFQFANISYPFWFVVTVLFETAFIVIAMLYLLIRYIVRK